MAPAEPERIAEFEKTRAISEQEASLTENGEVPVEEEDPNRGGIKVKGEKEPTEVKTNENNKRQTLEESLKAEKQRLEEKLANNKNSAGYHPEQAQIDGINKELESLRNNTIFENEEEPSSNPTNEDYIKNTQTQIKATQEELKNLSSDGSSGPRKQVLERQLTYLQEHEKNLQNGTGTLETPPAEEEQAKNTAKETVKDIQQEAQKIKDAKAELEANKKNLTEEEYKKEEAKLTEQATALREEVEERQKMQKFEEVKAAALKSVALRENKGPFTEDVQNLEEETRQLEADKTKLTPEQYEKAQTELSLKANKLAERILDKNIKEGFSDIKKKATELVKQRDSKEITQQEYQERLSELDERSKQLEDYSNRITTNNDQITTSEENVTKRTRDDVIRDSFQLKDAKAALEEKKQTGQISDAEYNRQKAELKKRDIALREESKKLNAESEKITKELEDAKLEAFEDLLASSDKGEFAGDVQELEKEKRQLEAEKSKLSAEELRQREKELGLKAEKIAERALAKNIEKEFSDINEEAIKLAEQKDSGEITEEQYKEGLSKLDEESQKLERILNRMTSNFNEAQESKQRDAERKELNSIEDGIGTLKDAKAALEKQKGQIPDAEYNRQKAQLDMEVARLKEEASTLAEQAKNGGGIKEAASFLGKEIDKLGQPEAEPEEQTAWEKEYNLSVKKQEEQTALIKDVTGVELDPSSRTLGELQEALGVEATEKMDPKTAQAVGNFVQTIKNSDQMTPQQKVQTLTDLAIRTIQNRQDAFIEEKEAQALQDAFEGAITDVLQGVKNSKERGELRDEVEKAYKEIEQKYKDGTTNLSE